MALYMENVRQNLDWKQTLLLFLAFKTFKLKILSVCVSLYIYVNLFLKPYKTYPNFYLLYDCTLDLALCILKCPCWESGHC